MMQMYASASVAGYAMILARHVAIIRAIPNYHAAMEMWMLHGNVSRKGYGNAL